MIDIGIVKLHVCWNSIIATFLNIDEYMHTNTHTFIYFAYLVRPQAAHPSPPALHDGRKVEQSENKTYVSILTINRVIGDCNL